MIDLTIEELKWLWKIERYLPTTSERYSIMRKVNNELALLGWAGNPLTHIITNEKITK